MMPFEAGPDYEHGYDTYFFEELEDISEGAKDYHADKGIGWARTVVRFAYVQNPSKRGRMLRLAKLNGATLTIAQDAEIL